MFEKLFACVLLIGLITAPVCADIADGLVGYWPLDEGTGNVTADATDNGSDGILNGGPVWVDGMFAGALEFDGSDDHVDCGNPPILDFGKGDWAVSAWINTTATEKGTVYAKGSDNSGGIRYTLAVGENTTGAVTLTTDDNATKRQAVGVTMVNDGNWHHVMGIKSGDVASVYVDGILDGSMDLPAYDLSGTSQANAYIGAIDGASDSSVALEKYFAGVIDEVAVWNRALTEEEIEFLWNGGAGNPMSAFAPEEASNPFPPDEAPDVVRDLVFVWMPGEYAATHNVYLGTVFEDVNAASPDVLVSEGQDANSYDAGRLDFGETYYWRIDEVNGAPDNTVFVGDVWSFTVEPLAYPIADVVATSNSLSEAGSGLENTVNGSGLDEKGQHSVDGTDMWLGAAAEGEEIWLQYEFDQAYKLHEMLVWNHNGEFEPVLGFGVKDATIEYSTDGVEWMVLGDFEFAQSTATTDYVANTAVDFGGATIQFVKITVHSNWGGRASFGLSEVRFLYTPVLPRKPEPVDGYTNVDVDLTLSWRSGREAASHDVYFGTNAEVLELMGNVSDNAFAIKALDYDTTYYWRVTEVNEAEVVSAWEGDVWSFSTLEYAVVDDFESYNDEDNVIYEAWKDGWYNETGSTVGYFEAPFAEQTVVHDGVQSMPLFYDNAGVATAEADLALSDDWTTNGIQSLSLYFYGDAENAAAQLYVKINDTRIDYDGPQGNIQRPSWQLWSIDLSEAGNLSNVRSLTIGLEGSGASGVLYIDDICLYPQVLDDSRADITGAGDLVQGVPNDNDWPSNEHPALAIDDDTSTKFLHLKGFSETTGIQVTPSVGATIVTEVTFTAANDAPERDPVAFELYGSNVSIDGPYTLITSDEIVDFAQDTAWPRFTKTETEISFDNDVAYEHYQVLFTAVRDSDSANSMQIGEIELIGVLTQ